MPLCAVADIADGGAFAIEVRIGEDDESLLLLRRGDAVRAFHNVCPHAGRRLDWAPGQFLFSAGQLVCAAHGAMFSLPDGLCTAGPCRGDSLREVAVRVRDGEVLLVRS